MLETKQQLRTSVRDEVLERVATWIRPSDVRERLGLSSVAMAFCIVSFTWSNSRPVS